MVMEMIRSGDVKEDNEEYQSVLDELFERLEAKNPEHIALKYYRAYHSGSAKTLKSIQISLVSRLEKFNLDSLAGITQIDEMELESIGEKKTAVFAVMALRSTISQDFMTVYAVVIAFYFGTQSQKVQEVLDGGGQ